MAVVLDRYAALVEHRLESFLREIDAPYLGEPVRYHLKTGGKRIRPALCLFCCEAFGGDVDQALPFAVAVELLHNMFLVHDDIEDGDETTTFEYDESGRLSVIHLPNGNESFYYNDYGDSIQTDDPTGAGLIHEWDENTGGNDTTRMMWGVLRSYTVDENDRNNGVVDHDGDQVVGLDYDDMMRVTTETDGNGHSTSYQYGDNGYLLKVTDPTGAVTSYEIGANGRLASVTDPLGHKTSYSYDENGNLIKITGPDGKSVSYEYNTNGQVTSRTDKLGNKTTYSYDGNGYLQSVTDPLGNTTSYSHDAAGRVTAVQDPLGNVTQYEYSVFSQAFFGVVSWRRGSVANRASS